MNTLARRYPLAKDVPGSVVVAAVAVAAVAAAVAAAPQTLENPRNTSNKSV